MKAGWPPQDFWKDAVERVVFSFLFGVISDVLVDLGDNSRIDKPWAMLLTGGIMGALSTAKAIIGSLKNDTTTPVSLF